MNTRLLFLLTTFVVSSLTLSAQNSMVTLSQGVMSIKELIQAIQTQSPYSFAFANSTLDTSLQVSLDSNNKSLKSLLDLISSTGNCTYVIKSRFILFQPALPEEEVEEVVEIRELNDVYHPSDQSCIDREQLDRPAYQLPDSVVYAEKTLYEYPELEWKEPYSIYNDPKVYGSISNQLPRFALRTNLLYWAVARTPNLSAEIGLSPRLTLELTGAYSPWNSHEKSKKLEHLLVRPELRYWLAERYTGHYFGVHVLYANYDIKSYDVPLLFKSRNRYDGDAFGAGLSYGFQLPLSPQWAVEFTAGVGVARLSYDKHYRGTSTKEHKVYVGPTKIGLNVVYLLK